MKGENKASERGESHAKSHSSESVKQIEKVGSTGAGIKFPVHDHPDHSRVHGDGGKGCKP